MLCPEGPEASRGITKHPQMPTCIERWFNDNVHTPEPNRRVTARFVGVVALGYFLQGTLDLISLALQFYLIRSLHYNPAEALDPQIPLRVRV